MRTEPLVHVDRPRPRDSVSAALQDLGPPAWYLADQKGRPVQLSTAGCVLHFRRDYELRVALPESGTPLELHVVSRPPFLAAHDTQVVAKHGREYLCLKLHVERASPWYRFFRWPYDVLAGDLEVACRGAASGDEAVLTCPVVARTSWTAGIVMLLIVGTAAGWLLGQFGVLLRADWEHGRWPPQGFWEWWGQMQSSPRFWLWPATLAALNPLAALAGNAYQLWQRSRVLEQRYRAFVAGAEPAPSRARGAAE